MYSTHLYPSGAGAVVGNYPAERRITPRPTKARAAWRSNERRTGMWTVQRIAPSGVAIPSIRRDWLDAALALLGSVVGWLTPLLLRAIGNDLGGTFYEYGEAILCPLFACFGAGLGVMSGVLWGTARPGVANGKRKFAE